MTERQRFTGSCGLFGEDATVEFMDVIRTRRSVRSFSGEPIPDEVLLRALEAARIAPSGNNHQPWRFVVVRDARKRRAIAEACYDQAFVANAPVVVVCCAIPYPNGYEPWGEKSFLADAVIAIDHMILAARDQGLGTCWVGAVREAEVKKVVKAPQDVAAVMVVPMGYPADDSAFTDVAWRRPMEEICFFEEYGSSRGA